jgi:hypothetical protein
VREGGKKRKITGREVGSEEVREGDRDYRSGGRGRRR